MVAASGELKATERVVGRDGRRLGEAEGKKKAVHSVAGAAQRVMIPRPSRRLLGGVCAGGIAAVHVFVCVFIT